MELPGPRPLPMLIKFEGIFDMDGLYQMCVKFFNEQGFEFHEDTYKGRKDEIEISWRPEKKVNEYIEYHIKVKVHITDMKIVDVVKEGKKVKLTSGRARFEIDMSIKTDYSGRFKGHPWMEKLKYFYDNFVLKKEMDSYYEDQLYYHCIKVQTIIKEYLDMETKTNAYYDMW